MKSAIVFLTVVSVAIAAKLEAGKPTGRPLMHPELKRSNERQSLTCYDGPNQTGNRVT